MTSWPWIWFLSMVSCRWKVVSRRRPANVLKVRLKWAKEVLMRMNSQKFALIWKRRAKSSMVNVFVDRSVAKYWLKCLWCWFETGSWRSSAKCRWILVVESNDVRLVRRWAAEDSWRMLNKRTTRWDRSWGMSVDDKDQHTVSLELRRSQSTQLLLVSLDCYDFRLCFVDQSYVRIECGQMDVLLRIRIHAYCIWWLSYVLKSWFQWMSEENYLSYFFYMVGFNCTILVVGVFSQQETDFVSLKEVKYRLNWKYHQTCVMLYINQAWICFFLKKSRWSKLFFLSLVWIKTSGRDRQIMYINRRFLFRTMKNHATYSDLFFWRQAVSEKQKNTDSWYLLSNESQYVLSALTYVNLKGIITAANDTELYWTIKLFLFISVFDISLLLVFVEYHENKRRVLMSHSAIDHDHASEHALILTIFNRKFHTPAKRFVQIFV